jgi:hypothetical protein
VNVETTSEINIREKLLNKFKNKDVQPADHELISIER